MSTVTAELGFVSPAYHVEVRDKLQAEIDRLRGHLTEIQVCLATVGFPSEKLAAIRNHTALALYGSQSESKEPSDAG